MTYQQTIAKVALEICGKCSGDEEEEHLCFTEEQHEMGFESGKDMGVKERKYS